MAFPVFFDTCTLFGQVVNDLLLNLAERGCFTPYWSSEVLDALERSVVATGRASAELIHRRRLMMEQAFQTATVEGYHHLVDRMENDPRDRHVLAACVVSPANTLVTFNLKDFPAGAIAPYSIEVVHPDDFVLDQLDLHPIWSREAVMRMLRANRMPPQDVASLAVALRANDMHKSALAIERMP